MVAAPCVDTTADHPSPHRPGRNGNESTRFFVIAADEGSEPHQAKPAP
jgi:hypothetical protein